MKIINKLKIYNSLSESEVEMTYNSLLSQYESDEAKKFNEPIIIRLIFVVINLNKIYTVFSTSANIDQKVEYITATRLQDVPSEFLHYNEVLIARGTILDYVQTLDIAQYQVDKRYDGDIIPIVKLINYNTDEITLVLPKVFGDNLFISNLPIIAAGDTTEGEALFVAYSVRIGISWDNMIINCDDVNIYCEDDLTSSSATNFANGSFLSKLTEIPDDVIKGNYLIVDRVYSNNDFKIGQFIDKNYASMLVA